MASETMELPHFKGKVYDSLKFVTQIGLPGVATFYFTIAGIWGLPNAGKIVGTITAFDLLMGVLLGLSSVAYNKSDSKYDGVVEVNEDEDGIKRLSSLQLHPDKAPSDLAAKDEVTFKVNKQ